ncbi:hypothetical protein AHAS_Ahas16G0292900 [Arachis hypogaea]
MVSIPNSEFTISSCATPLPSALLLAVTQIHRIHRHIVRRTLQLHTVAIPLRVLPCNNTHQRFQNANLSTPDASARREQRNKNGAQHNKATATVEEGLHQCCVSLNPEVT